MRAGSSPPCALAPPVVRRASSRPGPTAGGVLSLISYPRWVFSTVPPGRVGSVNEGVDDVRPHRWSGFGREAH